MRLGRLNDEEPKPINPQSPNVSSVSCRPVLNPEVDAKQKTTYKDT